MCTHPAAAEVDAAAASTDTAVALRLSFFCRDAAPHQIQMSAPCYDAGTTRVGAVCGMWRWNERFHPIRSIPTFPSFKLCVKSGFAEQESGGHEYFMALRTRSSQLSPSL